MNKITIEMPVGIYGTATLTFDEEHAKNPQFIKTVAAMVIGRQSNTALLLVGANVTRLGLPLEVLPSLLSPPGMPHPLAEAVVKGLMTQVVESDDVDTLEKLAKFMHANVHMFKECGKAVKDIEKQREKGDEGEEWKKGGRKT